jgi:hypothetical protein
LVSIAEFNTQSDIRELRLAVREFIKEEKENGTFTVRCDASISGFSPEFSKRLANNGWIGMTIPNKYGGQEKSNLERYVVLEELLSKGAPVSAHWVADRQTAPLLLKFGTEEQKVKYLPSICKGELYFAIGLSEPNSGSDLASLSTRAEDKGDHYLLNGSKIWTTGAHHAHYILVLCRTSPKNEKNKYEGMSQIIVDLTSPGVTIRPVYLMTGEHEFNEVFFEDVKVPKENLVGVEGNGWPQGLTELAFERSGPERFLSTYPLLEELIDTIKSDGNERSDLRDLGSCIASLVTLRKMSLEVASLLEQKKTPNTEAAMVKDLGTQLENQIIHTARNTASIYPSLDSDKRIEVYAAQSILHSPGFTLRGGTTEILRTIISKGVMNSG